MPQAVEVKLVHWRAPSTARSTIHGRPAPRPLVTSVGPGNCCTDAESISVSSRGIGTGALLPLVFSGPTSLYPWDHWTLGKHDAACEVHVFDPQGDSLGDAQARERAEQDRNPQVFGHGVVELPHLRLSGSTARRGR